MSPADAFAPNPRTVDGASGDWVVYPFIEGRSYAGSWEEIEAAGELLGRIHAAGAELGRDMRGIRRLPVHDAGWFRTEADKALSAVRAAAPQVAARFEKTLALRLAIHSETVPVLANADLPLAACSWDFKASNLVYVDGRRPVLVDPDHGGRLPRLFDLACSLLLFHSDCAAAPGKLFDIAEWEGFRAGYSRFVRFTEVENQHWPDVRLAAWIDQAMWLLGNWPEGWNDARTSACLTDLATRDLTAFEIG